MRNRALPALFQSVGVVRIFSAAALLAFAGACGQGDAVGEAIFTPEVVSTAAVPQSENDQVALLADERTACAIDSYESQIHCVDGEGAVVGVFGRKGEGPGEFGSPAYLAHGEEGTVGVADLELGRFTVFEPSGAYVSDVMLPGRLFEPLRSFGQVLSGVSVDILAMLGGETSGSLMTRFDVNIASGEVVREEGSPRGPWDGSPEQPPTDRRCSLRRVPRVCLVGPVQTGCAERQLFQSPQIPELARNRPRY